MSRTSRSPFARALLIAAFLTAPMTLFAQDAKEGGLTGEGLALGTEIDDTPRPGDTYIKETFQDWSLRCVVVADADDLCQMYQLLSDSNGSPVAEFTAFRLPEGGQAAAGATIVVPLETALVEQLAIKVDDAAGRKYPYAYCNTIGCYARIGLTQADVEAYKRGAEAVLSIVPIAAPDQRVNVTLSLKGFTAAFEASSYLTQ
ncbi:invasion associated locus B family protein [Roseobacter denitrificans]|nr:invasion associated locus B family protein [Roseobacter denitrificans]SFF78258.1 Invasion protein IalB, involved in pathogenesis [Roseobacter denitrificans OCh 114]